MSSILLVDDNPAHRMLARRALARHFPKFVTHEAESVEKALGLLRANGRDIALAVIDFNLNNESGLKIIEFIRTEATAHELPVIVISTSELAQDVSSSYSAGANSFLVKASDPVQFEADLISAAVFFLPM